EFGVELGISLVDFGIELGKALLKHGTLLGKTRVQHVRKLVNGEQVVPECLSHKLCLYLRLGFRHAGLPEAARVAKCVECHACHDSSSTNGRKDGSIIVPPRLVANIQ